MEKLILRGEKVTLREVETTDYRNIYENIQDKKIALYVGTPYPYGEMEAKHFISYAQKSVANKTEVQLAITNKETAQFMGMIGLMLNAKFPTAEIGFWLSDKYRGKGYIPEACKLIMEHGFEKLNLKRIYARAYRQNRSSCRVFEKLGFKLEGTTREDVYRFGLVFDTNYYGLLKSEFKIL